MRKTPWKNTFARLASRVPRLVRAPHPARHEPSRAPRRTKRSRVGCSPLPIDDEEEDETPPSLPWR